MAAVNGAEDAVFVGGPRDGERSVIPAFETDIFAFELPAAGPEWLAPHLVPIIRTYRRVYETPQGVAVYECQPLEYRTTFEVTVTTNAPPRTEQMREEMERRLSEQRSDEITDVSVSVDN